jgi:5'-nucleotidase
MKEILLTNDDGYESAGLYALIEALSPLGHVTVVAPTIEKSASGHSLTLTRPLRFIEVDDDFFKLDDGTPTDCVFLALNKLYHPGRLPDIVISGINKGANMGEDITYSGTAAAAMEATLQGIPAIAISQVCEGNCQDVDRLGYELAKESIRALVKKIFDGSFPLPDREFLNINIPPIKPEQSKGFAATRAGKRAYGNDAKVHHNPRGLEYHWIGLPRLDWLESDGGLTDFEAVSQYHTSITPIQLDMTAHKMIDSLQSWIDDANKQ